MGEFVNGEPDLSAIKPSFTSSTRPENPRSKSLIEALSLEPHIEGGYFRQTDANPVSIPSTYSSEALSDQTLTLSGPTREGYRADTRRLSTTIYYLLTPRQSQGNFHRNRSRVIHTLHRGRGRYVLIHPDGRIESFIVGNAVERGERIQWIVEGDVWKASYLLANESRSSHESGELETEGLLISETVVPGFEYHDHTFLTHHGIRELLKEDQVCELDWLVRKPEQKLDENDRVAPFGSPDI
ncbi:hypothetical protein F53441_3126 [Fusarium austroafricanum]|uniref:DUF985 domain-containing protein n=1 Tax=Fusarium austroafricanum TaxID=2364996 RepID=A0A8H4KQC7_9HYPO|nr:hypothetical protein F53441_3126 [Fusarium austroafricanum]